MLLGQAIDLVVVQKHRDVHVVANGMDPVRGADTAAVAVAGIDKHGQVGARHLDTLGHRQGAPMDAVETVGFHVMGKTARAADSGHEHRLFRTQSLVATQPLYRCQYGVVAATGAPARHAALIVFEFEMLIAHLQQAFCGGHHVHLLVTFLYCFSFCINTRRIVPGLIGWPLTSLQQSISTR